MVGLPVLQMLMDLGKPTYEEDFEKHFLAAAADFYGKEAQEFISTSNAPDYLRKVCTAAAEHVLDAQDSVASPSCAKAVIYVSSYQAQTCFRNVHV